MLSKVDRRCGCGWLVSFEDMLTRFANFHMHHDRNKYNRWLSSLSRSKITLFVVFFQSSFQLWLFSDVEIMNVDFSLNEMLCACVGVSVTGRCIGFIQKNRESGGNLSWDCLSRKPLIFAIIKEILQLHHRSCTAWIEADHVTFLKLILPACEAYSSENMISKWGKCAGFGCSTCTRLWKNLQARRILRQINNS